jgi:hypothetical protein
MSAFPITSVYPTEERKMGYYDDYEEKCHNSCALWKLEGKDNKVPKTPLTVLREVTLRGATMIPVLHCETLDGEQWDLIGAKKEVIAQCIKQWTKNELEWGIIGLVPSKTRAGYDVVPLGEKTVREECV